MLGINKQTALPLYAAWVLCLSAALQPLHFLVPACLPIEYPIFVLLLLAVIPDLFDHTNNMY